MKKAVFNGKNAIFFYKLVQLVEVYTKNIIPTEKKP